MGNLSEQLNVAKQPQSPIKQKSPIEIASQRTDDYRSGVKAVQMALSDNKLEQDDFRRAKLGALFGDVMKGYTEQANKYGGVQKIQEMLAKLYPNLGIKADNDFGPITAHALVLFQSEHPELKDEYGKILDKTMTKLAQRIQDINFPKASGTIKQSSKIIQMPVGNISQGISGPTETLGQTRISRTSPFLKPDNIPAQPQAQARVATEKKEEGLLMGVLKDLGVQKTIDKVSDAFGVATERMMALITRESNGEVKAKSSTGSKGITQLTTSVFRDMGAYVNEKGKRVGRGITEYADNLKKIPDEIVSAVGGKFEEVVQRIKANVGKEKPDPSQNERDIKELQKLVSQATNKGDYRPNLLLGTLYFSSIVDRYENIPLSKMQKEVSAIQKINRGFLNSMLKAKNFTPLSSSEFEDFKKGLVKDEQKMRDFCSLAAYNGQSNTHHGVKHKIYYAAAIMASEKQIKQSSDGLYRYA